MDRLGNGEFFAGYVYFAKEQMEINLAKVNSKAYFCSAAVLYDVSAGNVSEHDIRFEHVARAASLRRPAASGRGLPHRGRVLRSYRPQVLYTP